MRSSASMQFGPPFGHHLGRAQRAGRSRRGSALVIVIGTLALISVFAAIYISIGQSDRLSASTVRQRTDLGEITDAYAEHVADVIARDRLDTIMQPVDAGRQFQVPKRVLTDAPYTDWTQRSESNEPWRLFNPAGGNRYARPRNEPGDDPRVPSDPWLASLRPTFLGDVRFSPFSGGLDEKRYLDNRDWYQISNFAPDGRFVNLFNLRPVQGPTFTGGNAFGGFEAEPGFGVSIDSSGRRIRRMSEGLSLYEKQDPADPQSPIQSFNPFATGEIWLPGANLPTTPAAISFTPADFANTPAIFTMYQRYAFLPADQSFITYNRNGQVSSWADPDFPPYQWADTDGDGMYDARWFELTAAQTPAPSGQPRDDIQRFYDSGEYRVFAAVRAIDLSAMVNVNTATEALTPPTEDFPLGLTPAEIDLRRLLTMQDPASEYRGGPTASFPLSYLFAHQPYNIQGTGNQQALRTESDYRVHRHLVIPGSSLLDPQGSAMLVGRYAAAAARRGMERHATLGPQYRGFLSVDANQTDPFALPEGSIFQKSLVGATPNPTTDFNLLAGGRAEQYFRVGRADPSRLADVGSAPYSDQAGEGVADSTYYGAGDTLPYALYGVDDLAELLTYHGINDPETTSRLEQNMLGRFDGPQGEERLSPLLSTRPLDLDRYRHSQVRFPPADTNPNRPRRITGEIADDSMALFELSPRAYMTPLSGAVPLPSFGVAGRTVQAAGGQASNVQPAGVAGLTLGDASKTLRDVASSTGNAFDVFYNALAGELEAYRVKRAVGQDGPPANILNQIWIPDLTLSRSSPYSTLFYGHRGPELALRTAAHAGVNLQANFNGSQELSVATLVLDNQFGELPAYRDLVDDRSVDPPANRDPLGAGGGLGVYFPGLINANTTLDLDAPREGVNRIPDDQRVLPEGLLPARRQAVNVIGVEPMPVISEVASWYVYLDAAEAAGGMPDSSTDPGGFPPRPGQIEEVTINGDVTQGNADLMALVFAVQLHNPFDVAIDLSGATGPQSIMWRVGKDDQNDRFNPDNNLEFLYYIEFNGRFYKLGEFQEYLPENDLNPANPNPGFTQEQLNEIADAGGSLPPTPAGGTTLLPTSPGTPLEFQYRGRRLEPGETRTFYVTAHPRYDHLNPSPAFNPTPEERWRQNFGAYGEAIPTAYVSTDPDLWDLDQDTLPDGRDRRGWTGMAQEFIETGLGVETSGVSSLFAASRMHAFDPRTGELVDQGVFVDPMGSGITPLLPGRPADDSEVRLWRKYVVKDIEETPASIATEPNPPANAIRENLVNNDILVDRLFLDDSSAGGTTESFLRVPLAPGQNQIEGTVSLDENLSYNCSSTGLVRRNDNTGMSIVRWSTVRRRDRQASLNDPGELGRILPWAIQSRGNPSSTRIRATNDGTKPSGTVPEAFTNTLTWDLFFEMCNAGEPPDRFTSARREWQASDPRSYDIAYTPRDLFTKVRSRAGAYPATIGQRPADKIGGLQNPAAGSRFPTQTLGSNPVGDTLHDGDPVLSPEVFLGKTLNSSRIAEALLTMGIGPTWAPDFTRPLTDYSFDDREWMTLPEALAAALGYETFNIADPAEAEAANAVWHDAVRNTNTVPEYVLDNLHLRLDDYVAFLNVINAGEIGANERPDFTSSPSSPASDYRRGSGVPMALGVVDQLRPFGVYELPGDAGLPTELKSRLRLTRPVMGLVNVQTAPLRVLRLLPGLTPSPEVYSPIEGTARLPEWWGARGVAGVGEGLASDAGVAPLTSGVPRDNPDVAAGIAAYRDRAGAIPRARSRIDPSGAVGADLSFQPDLAFNSGAFVENLRAEFPNTAAPTDRTTIAGVPGLRSAPMFNSLGELLMVAATGDDPVVVGQAPNWRHLTMQSYFGDNANLGVDDSAGNDNRVSIDPKMSDGEVGATPDDYAERLALAAGVMNTTSVRSDYFAAWMVIQGFRESDITRLRPEDPLVPSFKKRYLMVIDRSNVVEEGDAPRIVLFKELPL